MGWAKMDMMMKGLKVFWGILALVIVIRLLLAYVPTGLNFSFVDTIMSKITEAKEETLSFSMVEQKGMVLATTKGCIKEYKAGVYEKGYAYGTNGNCMNGLCSLTVEFTQEIPKKVQLYVENYNTCTLQSYTVPKTLEILGYTVNLQLSKIQKKHLNIHEGDEVKLEHATGHYFSNKDRFYYYDTPLKEDTLLVNDKIVATVHF